MFPSWVGWKLVAFLNSLGSHRWSWLFSALCYWIECQWPLLSPGSVNYSMPRPHTTTLILVPDFDSLHQHWIFFFLHTNSDNAKRLSIRTARKTNLAPIRTPYLAIQDYGRPPFHTWDTTAAIPAQLAASNTRYLQIGNSYTNCTESGIHWR